MDLIGLGRVGGALAAGLAAHDLLGAALSRREGALDPDAIGRPVLVCTRNDDLDAVLARVPASRSRDLVFVQNGMIRPWLAAHHLEDAGRGLLFFAVARRGETPVPGPEPSPFTGPHAHVVAATLAALGLPAEAVGSDAFATSEIEKLVWNCAFGLLCDTYDASVGEVCQRHPEETRTLCRELTLLGAAALGVVVDADALVARNLAYSASIPDFRAGVREVAWRNGWFAGQPDAERLAPTHARLFKRR